MFSPHLIQNIIMISSFILTFVCFFNVALLINRASTRNRIKLAASLTSVLENNKTKVKLDERVLSQLKKSSFLANKVGILTSLSLKLEKYFPCSKEILLSGLKNSVTSFGLASTRLKLSVLVGVVCAIFGLLFSAELMFIFFFVGVIVGFVYPLNFLKKRIEVRRELLEKNLPEMLEILCIGMRSGLTFDRSLEIYTDNFNTQISNEFRNAQKLWTSGIKSRDLALRDIAKMYDSPVFSRIIESVIRNLRLGTSVSTSLLSSSKEARLNYQARREEQVRKAPIKMMIPTGTLILPAMLLLILGPVLLELVGGGV